jgi:hypothetical protein
MMKSGTLISVSLAARFIFKQHYGVYQWVAIGIVLFSLTMVGVAGVLGSESSDTIKTNKLWTGVILGMKLVSQLGYALRISYEEYFVQKKFYHPILICGAEGFWGFLVIGVAGMAVVHNLGGTEGSGLREDFWDTMVQIRHSATLGWIIGILTFLGLVYNTVSTTLIGRTSAVVRTLMEALRTFMIWMIQFVIFYSCQASKEYYDWRLVGEQWTTASFVQATGFALMVWGLLMYNRVPKYPCCTYETPRAAESETGMSAPLMAEAGVVVVQTI